MGKNTLYIKKKTFNRQTEWVTMSAIWVEMIKAQLEGCNQTSEQDKPLRNSQREKERKT